MAKCITTVFFVYTISLQCLAGCGRGGASSLEAENTQGNCGDQMDNDGDGYTDCEDQDCHIFVFCLDADGDSDNGADGDADADADTGPTTDGELDTDDTGTGVKDTETEDTDHVETAPPDTDTASERSTGSAPDIDTGSALDTDAADTVGDTITDMDSDTRTDSDTDVGTVGDTGFDTGTEPTADTQLDTETLLGTDTDTSAGTDDTTDTESAPDADAGSTWEADTSTEPALHYTFDNHTNNTGTKEGYDGVASSGEEIYANGIYGASIHARVNIHNWGEVVTSSTALTIGAWFMETQLNDWAYLLDFRRFSDPDVGIQVYHGATASAYLNSCWEVPSGEAECAGAAISYENAVNYWHHFLMRWDGEHLDYYIDNQIKWQQTPPGNPFELDPGQMLMLNTDGFYMDDLTIHLRVFDERGQCEFVLKGEWIQDACALPVQ